MGKGQKRKASITKSKWRKANIEDVEEAIEDDRMIAKLKKHSLKGDDSAASASELFTVDTKGSSEGISKASRREIARAKLFPPKGPNIGFSAAEEGKILRAEKSLGIKRAKATTEPGVFDLWASTPATPSQRSKAEASTVRREPIVRPSKVPRTMHQKASNAPAVLPAHEGQSMNPDAAAYEDLACTAAAKQIELEQEEEALNRKMKPISAALRDRFGAQAVSNMSEGEKIEKYRNLVCKSDAELAEEESGSHLAGAKALKIKAQSKRNREKKRKDKDALKSQALEQKRLDKSVGTIGAVLKEMKEEESHLQAKRAYKKDLRAKRRELEAKTGEVPRNRRLGKDKFSEEAMVVPDASAAKNGLRAMPLKGSAVKERLSSIVRRGMLDARPEATHGEVDRRKRKNNKLKLSRKFMSPLMRDNLLLR